MITRAPIVVAYGMGVDSTAMLVGLRARGIVPDLILFADTGDEKPDTYAYLPHINAWLERVGFPRVTVVKNARPKSGDVSLSAACLRTAVLPALAYGMHQCSLVWKRDPQDKYVRAWRPAIDARAAGLTVRKLIGYDAGPRDSRRCESSEGATSPGFTNEFPLIEWGWDRAECERQIVAAGLMIPVKSACFHCPASKKDEIVWLRDAHPKLYDRAIRMEDTARARGLKTVRGLGRKFSWAEV